MYTSSEELIFMWHNPAALLFQSSTAKFFSPISYSYRLIAGNFKVLKMKVNRIENYYKVSSVVINMLNTRIVNIYQILNKYIYSCY